MIAYPISLKTLLEMVGAPIVPVTPSDSVPVQIDAQLEYVDGGLPLKEIESAVCEAHGLLEFACSQGIPDFHVIHHGRRGEAVFDPNGRQAASIPALAPCGGETVVTKFPPNGFAGTDLHMLIPKTGRRELMFAGSATHVCVSATTRAAAYHAFESRGASRCG